MTDYFPIIDNLRRPRLLIQAARHGLSEYSRQRDLRRLVHSSTIPTPERALDSLIEAESQMEDARKTGNLGYNLGRHVEILIAILGEARLLPRPDRSEA